MQGFPFEPASQIAVCDTTKCRQLIVTNHNCLLLMIKQIPCPVHLLLIERKSLNMYVIDLCFYNTK